MGLKDFFKPNRTKILFVVVLIIFKIIATVFASAGVIECPTDLPYPLLCYVANPIDILWGIFPLNLIWYLGFIFISAFLGSFLAEDIALALGFYIPVIIIELPLFYLLSCFVFWLFKKIRKK